MYKCFSKEKEPFLWKILTNANDAWIYGLECSWTLLSPQTHTEEQLQDLKTWVWRLKVKSWLWHWVCGWSPPHIQWDPHLGPHLWRDPSDTLPADSLPSNCDTGSKQKTNSCALWAEVLHPADTWCSEHEPLPWSAVHWVTPAQPVSSEK